MLTDGREIAHEHVVRCYGVCRMEGRDAVASGYSIRCNMTKLNDLTTSERLFACLDVAYALEEVHKHGTYHGDVRLSNLHFDQSRSCALSDFALHRLTVHSFNGAVVPYWLSPESLLDGEYTEKSDSYSFAICIFRLASPRFLSCIR
jgi:serine/threonine protein kinase